MTEAELLRRDGHENRNRKAREILHDGTVHGKALTKKQRGFMEIGRAHV